MVDRQVSTEESLRGDLHALGVDEGATMVVHSSLSAIGYVVGGAATVVRALLGMVGEKGTLAMPAATPYCADPAEWPARKPPEEWLEATRQHLPVFDPETTPTAMGAIPESFRTWPGTRRSDHPLESICARGPLAREITRDHPLEFSEGRGGPFDKLRQRQALILLLGVGFNRCTALHHAESFVAKRRTMTNRVPMEKDGQRAWVEVANVADDNDAHFPIIGERYITAGRARAGLVGEARSFLFSMQDLVDFARRYFEETL